MLTVTVTTTAEKHRCSSWCLREGSRRELAWSCICVWAVVSDVTETKCGRVWAAHGFSTIRTL